MDQRGLVERARGGDHDAFTVLARDAGTRLDRAARLILRDPELARDAVQEALIEPGATSGCCVTPSGSTPGSIA